MVILLGNKGYYDRLGYIVMKCPECKTLRVFSVEQERKKLTVYFVPTFQYQSRQIITCSTCHESFEVDKELKSKIAKNIISQKELNSLRRRGKLKELTGSGKKQPSRRVAKIYCPSCENEIKKGMVYCPQCGIKL